MQFLLTEFLKSRVVHTRHSNLKEGFQPDFIAKVKAYKESTRGTFVDMYREQLGDIASLSQEESNQ